MWSVCLLCLRWADRRFHPPLQTLRVLCSNIQVFIRSEWVGGGLGGEGLRQILGGPTHFPLQRKDQGGQVTGFSGRNPTVTVAQTVTLIITTRVLLLAATSIGFKIFPCRHHLKNEFKNLDQQGGGSRYIGGSGNQPSDSLQRVPKNKQKASALSLVFAGETLYEVQQRLLKEREMKIRSTLEKLRRKRHLLRAQRKHKEFPIVSVLGYTNCGGRSQRWRAKHPDLQPADSEPNSSVFLTQGKPPWSRRWPATAAFSPETSSLPLWMSPFTPASCPVTWQSCTWTQSASCLSCRTSS